MQRVHWVMYSLLSVALLGMIWLWHDTQTRNKQDAVTVVDAKQEQAAVDKTFLDTKASELQALSKKNAALEKTFAAAKTSPQQVALINESLGLHLRETVTHQADNPSTTIAEIPVEELPVLARDATDLLEARNQVAVDKVLITGMTAQIGARDQTINDQGKQITDLKGGSHFKQFLRATKYVAIGVGVGIAIDRVVHK